MTRTTSSSVAVLDIETLSDINPEQLKSMVAKIQPPKGWKDPVKIKAKRDKDISDMIEKAALNPRTGRIAIVGVALRDVKVESGGWDYRIFVDRVADEGQLLKALDDHMFNNAVLNLVTFNGRKFDLPYLSMRAMAHKLRLLYRWPVGYHNRHTDMFDAFGKEGSLDSWIMGILGKSKDISGAAVARLLEAGEFDEAADHCLDDIQNTAELYDLYSDVVDTHRK